MEKCIEYACSITVLQVCRSRIMFHFHYHGLSVMKQITVAYLLLLLVSRIVYKLIYHFSKFKKALYKDLNKQSYNAGATLHR